jgi:hypothetical protein
VKPFLDTKYLPVVGDRQCCEGSTQTEMSSSGHHEPLCEITPDGEGDEQDETTTLRL